MKDKETNNKLDIDSETISVSKILSIKEQKDRLQYLFPLGEFTDTSENSFEWTYKIQPTAVSHFYTVVISYRLGENPKSFIKDKLRLAKGKKCLPYVYSSKEQQLGLYDPNNDKEWNGGMFISDTIVPWISEWLLFYEFWAITGRWFGGGITSSKIE